MIIDTSKLAAFFAEEPAAAFVIEGIRETEDSRYLGQVGLHKRDPVFRFAYWMGLCPDTHFRLEPFSAEEVGFDGIAVVLHQFTASKYQDSPEELLAGWVPSGMAERAGEWVEQFNADIRRRLLDSGQMPAQPSSV
ncbi:MAG: hypothetical protein EP330_13805 [Deltaproteobacteria bacterium]|nr:MAG: hypothetical protein EP330_13805 [Deltaproteobacteria bacterium]